jgi:DNA repair exonuclease SbcCD ATPase subunit
MEIRIVKTTQGFSISFPFELKDSFRQTFPTARWNKVSRSWETGPRSESRLQQWAQECRSAVDQLSQIEELEMKAEELEKLRAQIAEVSREITAKLQTIESKEALTQKLQQTAIELIASRDKLEKVESRLRQARSAQSDALKSVHAALEGIVDFEELKSACEMMSRWHRQVGATAREKFEEGQQTLLDIQEALSEAGWQNDGVDYMCAANFNRPDRDHFSLMPVGALQSFSKI